MGQRFEFDDGVSRKYWEIHQEGCRVEVRYAAIGKAPRLNERVFPTEGEAKVFVSGQIRSKVKKGYVETSPDSSEAAPARASDEAGQNEAGQNEARSGEVDSGVDYAVRVHQLHAELKGHPHIEVLLFHVGDPLPPDEVAKRVATLDVGEATRVALRDFYTQLGRLEFGWRLRDESGEHFGLNAQEIVGGTNICSLGEMLSSADYIDQGGFELDALDGFRVFEWDEQMYGYGIECDGSDEVSFVSDDGSRQRLSIDFPQWMEAVLYARGYRNFPAVVAGAHHPEASEFVIGTLFGEKDLVKRYPSLAPDFDPNRGLALAERLVPMLRAEGVEPTLVKGRATDYHDACLIFPYRFLRDHTARLEAVLSAACGRRTVFGSDLGVFYVEQPGWDIGAAGLPQYWSMIAAALAGGLPWDDARVRLSNIVDHTKQGHEFRGPRPAEEERGIAMGFSDLVEALDPDKDADTRALHLESVLAWRELDALVKDAESSLKRRARPVVAALRALAESV